MKCKNCAGPRTPQRCDYCGERAPEVKQPVKITTVADIDAAYDRQWADMIRNNSQQRLSWQAQQNSFRPGTYIEYTPDPTCPDAKPSFLGLLGGVVGHFAWRGL